VYGSISAYIRPGIFPQEDDVIDEDFSPATRPLSWIILSVKDVLSERQVAEPVVKVHTILRLGSKPHIPFVLIKEMYPDAVCFRRLQQAAVILIPVERAVDLRCGSGNAQKADR